MSGVGLNTNSIEDILTNLKQYYIQLAALQVSLQAKGSADVAVRLVNDFLTLRQGRLMAYLDQLSDKARAGHNCATCTGKCSIEHSSYLIELEHSHATIYEVLKHLDLADEQKDLKRLMSAALLIESTYLVPAIREAQTRINADY